MTPDSDAAPAINVADPLFISYRQSDGSSVAADLAWLLRAAGIPVWRDKDDLPPGDTEARLEQALAEGLSGAVLVITPEIEKSEIVKFTESPRIINLHGSNEVFALGIANAIERGAEKLDYDAPDRLLAKKKGTLSGVDQQGVSRDALIQLVKSMLWHRMKHHRERVAASDVTFKLSIQTRNIAQVYDRTGAEVDLRIRPSSHERLPSREGLLDLQATIGLLPDAVTRTAARRVQVAGGAHLSVAFALGAALPSSRVGTMEVVDQRGESWMSSTESALPVVARLRIAASEEPGRKVPIGRSQVAVYLDLINPASGSAFERYLEEHEAELDAWVHLAASSSILISASDAGEIAAEAAAHIRDLANRHRNAQVHLILRCPFPLAVLLGRLTNTLRFVLYEWDGSDPATGDDYRARYVPSLQVRASAAGGVIRQVLLPGETEGQA